MNTPNKLTVARMILVPFLVLFMLTDLGGEANRYIALAIFVVASVTDWFDGKLARKGYTASSPGIKKKWYGEEITGYEAVVEYLEYKYKPHPGIDLVVVAAMPYGEILQNAEGNVKKKYEVIAVARNEVKALSRKFKNAKFGIISHGKQDNI